MATATDISRTSSAGSGLKIVGWAILVAAAGIVVPGLGLLLAVILSLKTYRHQRAAQVLLIGLGLLALAFSFEQIGLLSLP